jgi:hypothetical protein
MSWLVTIGIAVLNAAIGCVGAGAIAAAAVHWYRIPSREGQSGYFVVYTAGLGTIAGLVLGVVVSRLVMHGSGEFDAMVGLKGLGAAVGTLVMVLGIAAGISRLRADVPPTVGGKELVVAVEVRLPEGRAIEVANTEEDARLGLASVNRRTHVRRKSWSGELILDKARCEAGRWLVPGRVEVWTDRGIRILEVKLGPIDEAFGVPLPRRPRKVGGDWSEWLPRARTDGGPAINVLSYRFRVELAE